MTGLNALTRSSMTRAWPRLVLKFTAEDTAAVSWLRDGVNSLSSSLMT